MAHALCEEGLGRGLSLRSLGEAGLSTPTGELHARLRAARAPAVGSLAAGEQELQAEATGGVGVCGGSRGMEPRGRAARTIMAKFVPLATFHLERSALNDPAPANCEAAGARGGGERARRRQGPRGRTALR